MSYENHEDPSDALAFRVIVGCTSVFWALASFGLIQDLIWAGITPSRFLIAVLFGPPAVGLFAVGVSIVRSRMRRASLPRLTGR